MKEKKKVKMKTLRLPFNEFNNPKSQLHYITRKISQSSNNILTRKNPQDANK